MRIIGIDPAPKKGLQVFDYLAGPGGDSDSHRPVNGSRAYVGELKKISHVLVCWDAPLTGPPTSVTSSSPPEADGSDFTQRPIESFFSRAPMKVPKGISMRGYGGCPHWTISRSLIGLPRVGPYDQADNLPFQLVTSQEAKPTSGRHVVEVHPALALWLWCRRAHKGPWEYKKNEEDRKKLWQVLLNQVLPALETLRLEAFKDIPEPSNDDQFDARISWLLGTLWLNDMGVILLGDADSGAMLVPDVPLSGKKTLHDEFRSFVQVR